MSQDPQTIGISPKAVLAFWFPVITATMVAVGNWASTGRFDANSIRAALAGLALGGVSAIGAYIGKPGQVVPVAPTEVVPEWPGSSTQADASAPPDASPADSTPSATPPPAGVA